MRQLDGFMSSTHSLLDLLTNRPTEITDYRPRSEGDNALGSVRPSVRPSVCPFVCALTAEPLPVEGGCLCVCNQWVYGDNRANAVNRRFISDTMPMFANWQLVLI